MNGDLEYHPGGCVLVEEFRLQHAREQRRLSFDQSEIKLKTVLLHNGNKHTSITVGHAVHMKETRAIIQSLLKTNELKRRHVLTWKLYLC